MPPPFSAIGIPLAAPQVFPDSAAAVDFTNLSTEFTYYVVMWQMTTTNAADQFLKLQVNGDSTAGHYTWSLSDGNGGGGSETSAVIGWLAASSNCVGMGQAYIPARHGGNTRNGMSWWGANGVGAVRNGTGIFSLSFNIASNVTSIHLFAAAGNLKGSSNVTNGIVSLYGML